MPAPTNDSFETATEITLPATVAQNPHFGGQQYYLYFRFTPTTTGMVRVFGFGDLTAYTPYTWIYTGPADDPDTVEPLVHGFNVPCQFWATEGVEYFLEVQASGANDNPAIALALQVAAVPLVRVPRGSYCINDEDPDYPLAILSPTTGEPIAFENPFPAGEFGVSMPSGYLILHDKDVNKPKIYNPSRTVLVATLNLTGYKIVACNAASFYAGLGDMPDSVVKKITIAGVIDTTYTLTSITGLVAMGVNQAGTILYFVDDASANQPIKRWDLENDVALSDLAAGLVNFSVPKDLFVLADDTILVAYFHASDASLRKVVHYSALGVVLDTIVVPNLNRICTAIADPDTFIAWSKTIEISTFAEITVDTGADVVTADGTIFDDGQYNGSMSATPTALTGHSGSCPIWVTRVTPPPDAGTIYATRRTRRFPLPFDRNLWLYIDRIEWLIQNGVGLSNPPGNDPQIMVRFSQDGGMTYGNELTVPAGKIGEYLRRSVLNRIGKFQNGFCEISMSDAVLWALMECWVDVSQSTN